MKRKIAILLSTMMVASAMPLSASAAYLNPNDTLNAAFAKANNTIDARVNKGYNSDYLKDDVTTEDLKERQSMLHFEFKEDKTGNIKAGDTFTIELENGRFDEKYIDTFQYVNSTSDNRAEAKKVTYDELKKAGVTTLEGAYDYIAKKGTKANPAYADKTDTSSTPTTVDAGTVTPFSKASEKETPVLNHVKNTIDFIVKNGDNGQAPGGAINTTSGDQASFVDAVDKVNGTKYGTWDALTQALAKEMADEKETNKVLLPNIPYEFKIVTPTTAEVTIPYELSNDDLKLSNVANVTVDTTKITDFKIVTTGTTAVDNTNGLKQSELSNVTGIALTGSGAIDTKTTEITGSYLTIPLGGVVADTDAPVKATVNARYTEKIKSGTQTITKNVTNGSTELVYAEKNVKYFEDYAYLEPVVISENVRDTIGKTNPQGTKQDGKVNLRLNSGFKFKLDGRDQFDVSKVKVYNDANGQVIPFKSGAEPKLSSNGSTLSFELNLASVNRNNPIGLRIGIEYTDSTGKTVFTGLPIEGVNSKQFGEVEITASGDGINTQSKLVAKRQALGYDLKTVKDPKEIIAGRHYTPNNYSYSSGTYNDTNSGTMVEGDNTTVEIQFSEKVPNTLVESRALDFTVPEGVKITDAYIDYNSVRYINGLQDADFEIINNGRTLRLKRDTYTVQNNGNSSNTLATFRFKLDLSVEPGFKGDIELSVNGGGQSEATKATIAKAVTPFEIKTQTTKANLGYQDYNTADITITEARPGMFLQNRTATLSLRAPYGTKELGFSNAKLEINSQELNIKDKDFKISNDGVISFYIDKASYKTPASITLKDVKVGTTRSVPYGSYSLSLSGDAVINNYASKVNDDKSFPINYGDKKSYDLYNQNNTSYYEFKDYLNVITETGTLDKTVKVSVGEKTVLVGNQAIDMDVAPYIQASSNSTMVPLRFVSVALGVDSGNVANPDASNKIAWDANTKTTTIYYGAGTSQKIIQFQAGSNIMTVDGTRIPMEYGVKAEIKDGRMFVPFRALGQALGVTVDWDADTRTAIYNKDNGRNADTTTTASTTTTESTTASTTKESSTESTTASTTKESSTETTTKKTN